jgi:hypothetical protein
MKNDKIPTFLACRFNDSLISSGFRLEKMMWENKFPVFLIFSVSVKLEQNIRWTYIFHTFVIIKNGQFKC